MTSTDVDISEGKEVEVDIFTFIALVITLFVCFCGFEFLKPHFSKMLTSLGSE